MNKRQKVWDIIKIILFVLFTSIAVICVTSRIVSTKKGKDATSIFHHEMRLVLTDSMNKDETTDVSNYKIKSIPKNSMVFIEEVPEDKEEAYDWYSKIEVGDVLTFVYRYDKQLVITHRVININKIDDGEKKGFVFNLMGDNKGGSDNPGVQVIDTTEENSFNYIIGKVVGKSVVLGALTTKIGICVIILVPSLTLLIYELIKISKILKENKKEKEDSKTATLQQGYEQQNLEIERLKQELEKLKSEKIESNKESQEEK